MCASIHEQIINFCLEYDFDIRKSHNGRWLDQKCTPDVLSIIADCVNHFVSKSSNSEFTTKDIWLYPYSTESIEFLFKKPNVQSQLAKNEYDKFFQQPMELLAYANVLNKSKIAGRNVYSINNSAVLEFIAQSEKNALFFLKVYIEKVLKDSGIFYVFENFLADQDHFTFKIVKEAFANLIISNTKINGITECNRIFTKVLNPLAYFYGRCGTERGQKSSQVITYDKLMYNRFNFRDLYADKPKGITRKQYAQECPINLDSKYLKYQSNRAKDALKKYNNAFRKGITEHEEEGQMNDPATMAHHIFPDKLYPEICSYIENLIVLTPTQHLAKAHPNNDTHKIDEEYQRLLLISKAKRICENLSDPDVEHIYDFDSFLFVLKVGFEYDDMPNIAYLDFKSLEDFINAHYEKLSKLKVPKQ